MVTATERTLLSPEISFINGGGRVHASRHCAPNRVPHGPLRGRQLRQPHFPSAAFQKIDIAVSLIGYPTPARWQVGQQGFFQAHFRRQSQLTAFCCQNPVEAGWVRRGDAGPLTPTGNSVPFQARSSDVSTVARSVTPGTASSVRGCRVGA